MMLILLPLCMLIHDGITIDLSMGRQTLELSNYQIIKLTD